MASRRPFRPAYALVVGPWFVAVDRLQPVALVLSADGEHSSPASWADLVPAPPVTAWPPRRVAGGSDRLVVQDLPDERPVTLTIGPDGTARPSLDAVPADLLARAKYPGFWAAPQPPMAPWSYESILTGYTWTGRVGYAGAADLAFPGAILDFAPAGDTALVCVQEADKRPWPFRRDTELVLLSAEGSRITSRPVPIPEIDALCWPSRFPAHGTKALHEYLRFTLQHADATAGTGVQDMRFVLRNTLTDPEIEIRFRHPDFPDREFRRIDRPFNELGNPGEGLRDMNVSLVQDIDAGILVHFAARTTDPVVYC